MKLKNVLVHINEDTKQVVGEEVLKCLGEVKPSCVTV